MIKNKANQIVGAQLFNLADGAPFTGQASVLVTLNNGAQAAGTETAPAHKGGGLHTYIPHEDETNGDHVVFTFTGTGAGNVSVQLYPVIEIDVNAQGQVSADMKKQNGVDVIGDGSNANKFRTANT